MFYVYKILRYTAWLLVLGTLLILFSGFFTTKFFLTPWLGYKTAYYIHTVIAPIIFLPLFYFHSLTGILVLVARKQRLNKKPIKIIAIILWTAVFAYFIYLYEAENPAVKAGAAVLPNKNLNSGAATVINNSQNEPAVLLSETEIKKHNQTSDCWMIISGKVYDFTNYLNNHPGGSETILPYCGGDGTNAFATKDRAYAQPHSNYAASLMDSYYIGNVGESAATQKINDIKNAPTVNQKSREDREDDD